MTTPGFHPTHVVPREGMPAWEAPDPSRPTVPLDALLPVELVERRGDWGRILCANGWSAWVDGRLLVAVPQDPPRAGSPLARTADPRPLLERAEHALAEYRRAVADLAAGGMDAESFHRRTRGLRIGMVVDGESLWLYEAEHERWVYCDGERLSTYAAERDPGAQGDPAYGGDAHHGGGPATRRTSAARAPGGGMDEATRVVDSGAFRVRGEPGAAGDPGGPPTAEESHGYDSTRPVSPRER
ncbi:hypothetical protein [Streptomyces cavernae]|uniref:hypothetical protein n=1 Tax=Streptomyces cavernae TaxID=2259034 RepID=UPI000FEB671E|nr:hypothetical protein [Streptomyces cavernae]